MMTFIDSSLNFDVLTCAESTPYFTHQVFEYMCVHVTTFLSI